MIDEGRRFELQTTVFLKTLISTGVDPSCILAYCTPTASEAARIEVRSFGVEIQQISPFLDGRYCNKLARLPDLLRRQADVFVLCDTDLAFLETLSPLFSSTHIRSKPVDLPNPPIDVLEELRALRKIDQAPRIVETSCDGTPTYSVNCNGGLYIIPRCLAESICNTWISETIAINSYRSLLGEYFVHLDQIGFAFAMLSCRYDIEEIPIEFNFPVHLSDHFRSRPIKEPKVLHYHWLQDENGLLRTTGHAAVDKSIYQVNQLLHPSEPREVWREC